MPLYLHAISRPRVMEHLTHAVANGFDRRMAQKLLDAYDLGLIVCADGPNGQMDIQYTPLGLEWNFQGQQWGVA